MKSIHEFTEENKQILDRAIPRINKMNDSNHLFQEVVNNFKALSSDPKTNLKMENENLESISLKFMGESYEIKFGNYLINMGNESHAITENAGVIYLYKLEENDKNIGTYFRNKLKEYSIDKLGNVDQHFTTEDVSIKIFMELLNDKFRKPAA